LRVQDQGTWFDFNPGLPRNPMAESGRGLFLVTALAEDVTVKPVPDDGKVVSVVLPVHAR
jgi:anti-sigma regulatory factor (Ser/Thr protein kinase)